jgi:hypothetical protein
VLGVFDIEYPLFSSLIGLFFIIAISVQVVLLRKKIGVSDLVRVGLVVMSMNAIVFGYYAVLLFPYWVILVRDTESHVPNNGERAKSNEGLFFLLALATAPIAWPSRWRIDDAIGADAAFNLIPIVVTLSIFGYLMSNVILGFLDALKRRNLELK